MRAPLTGHANMPLDFWVTVAAFLGRYLGAFIHHFRQGLLNHLLACPLLRDDLAVLFGYDVIHGFDAIPPDERPFVSPKEARRSCGQSFPACLVASPTPSPPFLPSAVLPVSLPAARPRSERISPPAGIQRHDVSRLHAKMPQLRRLYLPLSPYIPPACPSCP